MQQTNLEEENELLRKLLGLSGLPEEYRRRKLLLFDLIAMNSMVINMINKSTLMDIDLQQIGLSDMSTKDLQIPTENVPILPLFSIRPDVVSSIMEVCADRSVYPDVLMEQLRYL